jgi:mannose-6-phosphate isomerase class I
MFNTRPLNKVRNRELVCDIQEGYDSIFQTIKQSLKFTNDDIKYVAIDGTHGISFQAFKEKAIHYFTQHKYQVKVIDTSRFLKTEEQIRKYFENNITDNRAFGYVATNTLKDYFKENVFAMFKDTLLEELNTFNYGKKRICFVVGTGSYWINHGNYNLSLFLDISRELQQMKHKKNLLNFGFSNNQDAVEKYKIAYFVEWPILENYRKEKLGDFDYYIDINNEDKPTITSVQELFQMLQDVGKYPLRVKPFFAPGVWGGQYLKKMARLPETWENCAWSFEPIAPENSILIEQNDKVIEVPFLIMMSLTYQEIMGERVVKLFGDYFPIRFDYLDTIEGSNLSCQVHPKQKYIKNNFNEILEQQESYYIMESHEDSKVYLGLVPSCNKEEFYDAVNTSQVTGEPIEFTKYVQEWNSNNGDLFLIPTGTVHCSGKNNLVLEISSTTWWFTFKIYDYVRKDLDGKPRPINIDHAFENIDFYKTKEWVEDELIPQPVLIRQEGNNNEYLLGKRPDLLFYVNRIHLFDEWNDMTNGEFVMLNLVEGEKVRIVSNYDNSIYVEMGYAESYIIPSVFDKFKIINLGKSPCKLIKAGVSSEWNESIIS